MTLVLIIVGLLVSPVLIAPIAVPRARRRAEARLLKRLMDGGAGAFRDGTIVFREQFDFLDSCGREVVFCGSTSRCEGALYDVDELYSAPMKESDKESRRIEACVRIGIVCLRCGHLEKTAPSHLMSCRYRFIDSAESLAFVLEDRRSLLLMGVPI